MLDLVPVQLKIEGRSPGELFLAHVKTVYTQLNALVIHLSQVIPNVIEPEDIRKRSLHQQIGGGHVIEFQCSVYDIKNGKVKPNVVGCLSQIGSASGRERVGKYGTNTVWAGTLKKK